MKQGMTRKLKPKPKQDTKAWQRRNELRKGVQEAYAAEQARERSLADECSCPSCIVGIPGLEGDMH